MKKIKTIKELLDSGGNRLSALKARARARSGVLDLVRDALPQTLAKAVVSAGLEDGRLTVGVAGAAWAARLRYSTESLRTQVGQALAVDITSVRIRVVPPRAEGPLPKT